MSSFCFVYWLSDPPETEIHMDQYFLWLSLSRVTAVVLKTLRGIFCMPAWCVKGPGFLTPSAWPYVCSPCIMTDIAMRHFSCSNSSPSIQHILLISLLSLGVWGTVHWGGSEDANLAQLPVWPSQPIRVLRRLSISITQGQISKDVCRTLQPDS